MPTSSSSSIMGLAFGSFTKHLAMKSRKFADLDQAADIENSAESEPQSSTRVWRRRSAVLWASLRDSHGHQVL